MHAFLLIGSDGENLKIQIGELATKLHAKIMEFPLVKIDDVRSLNNLIQLSFDKPTLIVCQNIHEAGEEALNAFLKNLEEPQENIYFALTAPSTRKVLPTILSRCQVIKITSIKSSPSSEDKQITNFEDAEKFMGLSIGEKLNYTDKIKTRDDAIEFAVNAIAFLHSQLHQNDVSKACHQMVKYDVIVKDVEIAQKTLTRLKANGNVNLQLSNLVIQISNAK